MVVLVLWAASFFVVVRLFPDWPTRGTFGDAFGAVNALFSGLALAGVVYAIILQRNELALQREELSATRAELERSASAQEQSEAALRQQVEAQNLAASLTALGSLLSYHDSVTRGIGSSAEKRQSHDRAKIIAGEMQKVYLELRNTRST